MSLFYNAQYINNHYVKSNGQTILGDMSINQITSDPTPLNISFGSSQGYISFIIDPQGDTNFLVDSSALISISAISGTSGTYIRGVNALGLFMFDKFELRCNSVITNSITSDQVFVDLVYNVDSDIWSQIAKSIGYDTSTTNRNTLAGSAQNFRIPLYWLFNFFAKPVNLNLFKEIEVRFYLKSSINYCIQTDKTSPTFSFTSFVLDNQYVSPISKDIILGFGQQVLSNQFIFMDYDYLQKDFNIISGTSSSQLNMPELDGKNVADIFLVFRPAAQVKTNYTSDYTDSNVALTSWNIKSGSYFLNGADFDITYTYYTQLQLPRLQFNGVQNIINRNECVISFADNYINNSKEDIVFYSGSKPFKGIKDTIITINYATIGAAYVCSVLCRFAKVSYSEKQGSKAILASTYN